MKAKFGSANSIPPNIPSTVQISVLFRTPIGLLFVAYSIVIGVWGTIIYIILQIAKIKKMGKAV